MHQINIGSRKEVMSYLEPFMLNEMSEYLKPVDQMWQPADFLPDASRDTFFKKSGNYKMQRKPFPMMKLPFSSVIPSQRKLYQRMNLG